MYTKFSGTTAAGTKLKQHHHVSLDCEFREDCKVWENYLKEITHNILICRPFTDINGFDDAEDLEFFTDPSGWIGFGCLFAGRWSYGLWSQEFLAHFNPSIEYLEMFALCVGIFMWKCKLSNRKIAIYCDNTSVRDAVNDSSSKNKMTMTLVRLLILECLKFNIRVFVQYIKSSKNVLADSLLRANFENFWDHAPEGTCLTPEKIPRELWPVEKLWKVHEDWKSFKHRKDF